MALLIPKHNLEEGLANMVRHDHRFLIDGEWTVVGGESRELSSTLFLVIDYFGSSSLNIYRHPPIRTVDYQALRVSAVRKYFDSVCQSGGMADETPGAEDLAAGALSSGTSIFPVDGEGLHQALRVITKSSRLTD